MPPQYSQPQQYPGYSQPQQPVYAQQQQPVYAAQQHPAMQAPQWGQQQAFMQPQPGLSQPPPMAPPAYGSGARFGSSSAGLGPGLGLNMGHARTNSTGGCEIDGDAAKSIEHPRLLPPVTDSVYMTEQRQSITPYSYCRLDGQQPHCSNGTGNPATGRRAGGLCAPSGAAGSSFRLCWGKKTSPDLEPAAHNSQCSACNV